MSEIERLRALLEDADLPWRADVSDPGDVVIWSGPQPGKWVANVGAWGSNPTPDTVAARDAILVAAAVNALPALLDVAEGAREWRKHLRTPMGADNSEQMLRWAEREFQLAEAIGAAIYRLDGAS